MRIVATLSLILVLIASGIIIFLLIKAESKTITVPDDYSTIQNAIDNASAGDTVFVKKGTYYVDTIGISKPINLVGQDSAQTIINGQRSQSKAYPIPYDKSALAIDCSNTAISGFTITNCFIAISSGYHLNLTSVKITENHLIDNWVAIDLGVNTYLKATDFIISKNVFTNNTEAIDFSGTESEITDNQISGSVFSMQITEAENIAVSGNYFSDNSFGLLLSSNSNVNVYNNNFVRNVGDSYTTDEMGYGVEFSYDTSNATVHDNNFLENTHGINLENLLLITDYTPVQPGSGNLVYNNNFVNNNHNANVEHEYPYPEAYQELQIRYQYLNSSINGTDIVSWDNSIVGNYWSDYQGEGTYVIDENNVDHYPLTQQVDISTQAPTAPSGIPLLTIAVITTASAIVMGIMLLVYFKKHKRQPE